MQSNSPRDRAIAVFTAGSSNGEYGLPADQVVVMERGQGCRLWDSDGREFIDFSMAWGSCLVGHAHPDVVAAYYKDYLDDYPNLASAGWGFTVETATQGIRLVSPELNTDHEQRTFMDGEE